MFGHLPKTIWENKITTDRKNRMTLNLNCLLIQLGGKNIIVDTGVGSKEMDGLREQYGLGPSKLTKALKSMGVSPNQIDIVILTHLHFDHCGGCTRIDRAGDLIPTFPKAKHFVQKVCWDEAMSPSERFRSVYFERDFKPLQEWEQMELLDGDEEILPGLSVTRTDGPAKGHQIVTVNHGGERVAFLGDLVPTAHHLDLVSIPSFDQYPEETLEVKRDLLARAEREGWLIIFSHGTDHRAGYLENFRGRTQLRPVDL